MPRPPRVQFPNATYHVTARAAAHRALFPHDEDRSDFARLFGRVLDKRAWICHSACLLTTHYHLLIETLEADLAAGMQWLNGLYGRTFNRHHGGTGHVFEARYGAELVLTEKHFVASVRYIALNPVRAGLCERPEDWAWSSYAATFDANAPWPFPLSHTVLQQCGRTPAAARLALRRMMDDALEQDRLSAALPAA